MLGLKPIKMLPARERVAAALRKAIISRQITEGEVLTLESTAQELGVSITPVREAFQILERDGLIDLQQNKGAFGQYLICFRDYPVAIGITAGASEYLAADICLKYIKEAVQIPCEKENLEEAQEKLEEKLVHLTLPKPEGDKKDTNEATKKLLNKRIVFTENPRQIESAVISTVGEELKLELTVAGEKKILFAGYKDWKCNDMYPNDFTKRYHAVSYAFDEDALYLSVGLLNTSYREEYCLWVNSENVVVGTWRPNVTYLPAEEDMTWKFTGTFEPSCIL